MFLPFASCHRQEIYSHPSPGHGGRAVLVEYMQESRWADQLSKTQAQTHGFELAHLITEPLHELLECMKGPMLQNQSCQISMTEGNNRISKRVLLRIHYWQCIRSQRPRTTSITHCHGHLQRKLFGQMYILCDTLWHTTAPVVRFSFLFFNFYLCFLLQGRLQRWRAGIVGWGDEWDWGTCCEIHKNINKIFFYKVLQNQNSLSSLNTGFSLHILEQKQPNYAKESLYIKRNKEMKAMWAKGPKVFCMNQDLVAVIDESLISCQLSNSEPPDMIVCLKAKST